MKVKKPRRPGGNKGLVAGRDVGHREPVKRDSVHTPTLYYIALGSSLYVLSFVDLQRTCSAMDINDLHPPDDYSHRFFIWHEWIQVGFRPIDLPTFMDPFSRRTDPSRQRMSSNISLLLCSMISRAITRCFECKLFTLECLW